MRSFVIFAGSLAIATAQVGDSNPKFEVASIRPAGQIRPDGAVQTGIGSAVSGGPGTADPERIVYTHTSMQALLQNAYGVRGDGLSGPGWLTTETYDVAAKIPPGATKDQVSLMLQDLLIERFKLIAHHETKKVDGYTLAIAKNGPRLKESPADAGPPAVEKEGFPEIPPGVSLAFSSSSFRLAARQAKMAQIAQAFSSRLAQAPVVDKTGLTGVYDFALYFAPNKYFEDFEADFEAIVQKELGLKLEKAQIQIDVLVIDHIEKVPTAN